MKGLLPKINSPDHLFISPRTLAVKELTCSWYFLMKMSMFFNSFAANVDGSRHIQMNGDLNWILHK